MQIANNSAVSIHYTLTDDSGTEIDSSKGGDPLTYLHGGQNIIPGLEKELDGKKAGDTLKVRIAPEEAYGERDESMIHGVPREQLPAEVDIKPGMQFQAQGPEGTRIVTVLSVEGTQVKLDANHPLAGVALNFDVSVSEVRAATEEELSHGHVHGPGGHQH